MQTSYQLVSPGARKEIVRRKTFYERKLRECEVILKALDALPSFFDEHPLPEESSEEHQPETPAAPPDAPAWPEAEDASTDDALPPSTLHRPKEDLYDEEMLRLLERVKVASKAAVYQHFHTAFRGNTSIGAVESYLKRAVLRGTIVRLRRGEYTLQEEAA